MQEHKGIKLQKEREDHVLSLMKTGLEFQAKLFERIQTELNLMPEGAICRKLINGKNYYYHDTKDKNGKWVQRFIKTSEYDLKQCLMKKYYFKKCSKDLQTNIQLMKKFVQKYRTILADAEGEMLLVMAELMFDHDNKIQQWIREPFKRNTSFKEALIHTTTLGLRVRSKSEAIIVSILEANGVPYRYEAELILGEKTYYPDFTILCPSSGKILYWEHFGMLNNSNYRVSAEKKLFAYFENHLYSCDNFIMTYDKEDGSIDASVIQKLIHLMVLS